MAEKDVTEKILEAHNDVFADIVNTLVFKGKKGIDENTLEEQVPRAHYKADGRTREIERDVVKRWKSGSIRLACIGFENQTEEDADMALRVIGYDGAEYRAQLLRKQNGRDESKQELHYPVVTIVLYFGYKRRWSKPLLLKQRLQIPEGLDPLVNDYKVNLFEIAYMSREQVEQFQSDFRVVVDYFVQMREKNDYVPSEQNLVHVQETLQLLHVLTGDHRFEDICNDDTVKNLSEGRTINMCEVMDRAEKRGEERAAKKYEGALKEKDRMLQEQGNKIHRMEKEILNLQARLAAYGK